MISKKLGRATLAAFLLAAVAGCTQGDPSSTMMTDADGKAQKFENEDAPKKYASSEDAQKSTYGQNYMEKKGYKKR